MLEDKLPKPYNRDGTPRLFKSLWMLLWKLAYRTRLYLLSRRLGRKADWLDCYIDERKRY